jgi:hypothetical protein
MSSDLDLFVEGHPKSIGFQVLASDPTIPSLKTIGQAVLELPPYHVGIKVQFLIGNMQVFDPQNVPECTNF